jgi:hypothetical protein
MLCPRFPGIPSIYMSGLLLFRHSKLRFGDDRQRAPNEAGYFCGGAASSKDALTHLNGGRDVWRLAFIAKRFENR